MDIKTISDIIYEDTENRERMEKMNDVYYQMADYLKKHDLQTYKMFYEMAEGIVYEISRDQAEDMVKRMKPYGERWDFDSIVAFVNDRGERGHDVKYYMVMNMIYNDYCRTAKLYEVDDADFYYNLAYDFIHDVDAPAHKVEKYFLETAAH